MSCRYERFDTSCFEIFRTWAELLWKTFKLEIPITALKTFCSRYDSPMSWVKLIQFPIEQNILALWCRVDRCFIICSGRLRGSAARGPETYSLQQGQKTIYSSSKLHRMGKRYLQFDLHKLWLVGFPGDAFNYASFDSNQILFGVGSHVVISSN